MAVSHRLPGHPPRTRFAWRAPLLCEARSPFGGSSDFERGVPLAADYGWVGGLLGFWWIAGCRGWIGMFVNVRDVGWAEWCIWR